VELSPSWEAARNHRYEDQKSIVIIIIIIYCKYGYFTFSLCEKLLTELMEFIIIIIIIIIIIRRFKLIYIPSRYYCYCIFMFIAWISYWFLYTGLWNTPISGISYYILFSSEIKTDL
jgi:hypothetical protein